MRHAKDSANAPRAKHARKFRPNPGDSELARRESRRRKAYRRPSARRELEDALAEVEGSYL